MHTLEAIMKNVHRHLVLPFVLIGFVLLLGCSNVSRYMRLVPPGTMYRPGSQESLVIFLRPSPEDPQFQSSVFEVAPGEDKLVGIVSVQTKVAYITTPGEHIFMSIGMGAEFLKTQLDAGKTYYVLIAPVRATWKDQFILTPVKSNEGNTDKFKKSVETCAYVENTRSAYDWAQHNAKSIESKKRISWSKWERMSDAGKPALAPEDGI